MGWMTWIVIAVVVYSAWMYVYAMGARSTAAAPTKAATKESFVGIGVDQAEDFEAEERFETKKSAAEEKKKGAGAEPDKDMQTIFEDLSQASETLNAIMKRFKEKLYPSAKESFAAAAAAADAHEAEESEDEAPVKKKAATATATQTQTQAQAKKKKVVAAPVQEEQFEEPVPEEFEAPPQAVPDADAESFSAPHRVTAPVTRFRRVEGFTNGPARGPLRARYVQAPYSGVQSSAFYDSMEWIADD